MYLKGYALCRRLLLAPRGCYLGCLVPPFWQPGGPFWHLGSTLEDHRSSRMDTRGAGTGFSLISGWFVDVFWKLFGHCGLKFQFCLGLVSRSLFVPTFESKFGRMGLQKAGFRIEGIAETNFPQESIFKDFAVDFCRFLEALGTVFLGDRLENWWFFGGVADPKFDRCRR